MDGTSAFIRKNDKFKLAEAFMNNIRISSPKQSLSRLAKSCPSGKQ